VIASKVRDEISLGEDLGKQGREARERGGFETNFHAECYHKGMLVVKEFVWIC
jgi:hypothetical protein